MNQTDKIKHFLKMVLLFIALGVVFWLFFNLLGIGFISLLSSEDCFPSDGIWYCEELLLQVSFDDSKDCYITVDGDTIFCGYSIDKGSNWLSVICKDNGSEHFDLDDEVFGGELTQLKENNLIIRVPESNVEFSFIRLTDSNGK